MNNKVLLYGPGNYIQCPVISHSGDLAEAATLEPLMLSAMVSRTVFFHIAIDGEPLGRVSFEVKDLETKK